MKKLYEINFKGIDELIKLAREREELLRKNAETAVANTVLFAIVRVANDCPVNTGRARASFAGDLADLAGVNLEGDPRAIQDGKSQSVTGFSGLIGRIGSNVEYILYIEYRGEISQPRKLTPKQLAYLFANGILESDGDGNIIYNYKPKRNAKGFFRKNLPVIEAHFNQVMEDALQATREGRLLRKG